jgi:hypothetical protein
MLKRMFGPKKGCRKFHNEELHNFYSSPSIIRVIKLRWLRQVGNIACMAAMKNAKYKMLVRKPDRKRSFRRYRHRWEGNIRMDLREKGLEGVNWILLIHDRVHWQDVVSTVVNLWSY